MVMEVRAPEVENQIVPCGVIGRFLVARDLNQNTPVLPTCNPMEMEALVLEAVVPIVHYGEMQACLAVCSRRVHLLD